jgi:hypothetical protein
MDLNGIQTALSESKVYARTHVISSPWDILPQCRLWPQAKCILRVLRALQASTRRARSISVTSVLKLFYPRRTQRH